MRQKYGLESNPYVIFISTIQPRKNLPNLIAGFAEALKSSKVEPNTKLLIVGKKGWDYQDSLDAPQKEEIEDNAIFAGRVPDEDLPKLLSGSSVFASVSFEEGFGLTLLEAMKSKVPLVLSKIPSYESLAEGCAVFVDPASVSSIAQGLIRALISYPKEYIEEASTKVNQYSWKKTAQETLKVFNN